MSVSTTHRRPRQHSSMSTCKASCAERPGRNPKLHGKKSASKTGSSTIFTAACTIRSRTGGIESGLCSVGSRLRDKYPPGGQRTIRPSFSSAGQLAEQPGDAVLLDRGQGDLVDARRAVVRAHQRPRAPQHIPAADLVIQRVEPPSGIGLGRPVQRMLQGTDRISRDTPARSLRGGTSRPGTHRAPPRQTLRIGEAAALPSPAVMLSARLKQYYGRLRRPPGQQSTSRLAPVIGRHAPVTLPQATGPGRASPVPAVTIERSAPHTPGGP